MNPERYILEWKEEIFSDAINVNPTRVLKKEKKAKFVSMTDLHPFNKIIQGYGFRDFSGGSKFINNDTLMARITPCLENGKTAFVDILDKGETGFGSTEFIVLSAKEGKTTPHFVYYLATSPLIRPTVIKSMTGTSGRQRADSDIFNQISINLPSIPEQEAIVNILKSLDDKIELNQQMNNTLEQIGQAFFKRWFVDFEFPDEEGEPYRSSGGEMVDSELGEIPKGWKVGRLEGIIVNFDSKRVPLSSRERALRKGKYPYYGATSIMDYIDDYLFDGIYLLMAEDGSVIDESEHPVLQYIWGKFWVNNHAHVLQGKEGIPIEYVYLLLKQTNVKHLVTGAVQPKINQNNMNNLNVVIPPEDIISNFSKLVGCIFEKNRLNSDEITILSQIRDSLLPKLMSGELRVNVPESVSP
jgi:type I restriction enzyme S subunit